MSTATANPRASARGGFEDPSQESRFRFERVCRPATGRDLSTTGALRDLSRCLKQTQSPIAARAAGARAARATVCLHGGRLVTL